MITVYRHDPNTAQLVSREHFKHFDDATVSMWLDLDIEPHIAVTMVEESFTRAEIARALIGVKVP